MSKLVYGALAKVFAVVLLLAGIGAVAGGNYAHSFITEQLSQEKISMPTAEGIADLPAESKAALEPYIGQEMTTGPQAAAFANHYIWQHMQNIADGKTYEEVSGEFMKLSKDASADKEEVDKLGQQRQTLFMGDTLRGTLLNAYGWWTVGSIALYVGIGAIVLAVVLAILGFGVLRAPKAQA